MPNNYALTADTNINIGDTIPAHSNITVADNPRTLPITVTDKHGRVQNIADLITNEEFRVVTVEPDTGSHPDSGWKVTGVLPIHSLFGPQGERIVEVVNNLTALSDGPYDDKRANYESNLNHHNYYYARVAVVAAIDALRKVGVDDYWWSHHSYRYNWGAETIALAARDLIDTVPGWGPHAYNTIARVYRSTFGEPLHPDDSDNPNGPWHLVIRERRYTDEDVVRAIVRELGHDGSGKLGEEEFNVHEVVTAMELIRNLPGRMSRIQSDLRKVQRDTARLLAETTWHIP